MTKLAFCKDSSGYQVEEILWGGIRLKAGRQVRRLLHWSRRGAGVLDYGGNREDEEKWGRCRGGSGRLL